MTLQNIPNVLVAKSISWTLIFILMTLDALVLEDAEEDPDPDVVLAPIEIDNVFEEMRSRFVVKLSIFYTVTSNIDNVFFRLEHYKKKLYNVTIKLQKLMMNVTSHHLVELFVVWIVHIIYCKVILFENFC